MRWLVLAPSSNIYAPGALAGDYLGASAEVTAAVGAGANLLVGGMNGTFTLQPLSLQTQTGLNLARRRHQVPAAQHGQLTAQSFVSRHKAATSAALEEGGRQSRSARIFKILYSACRTRRSRINHFRLMGLLHLSSG